MIKTDKLTYFTVMRVLINCSLLSHKDVEEISYTQEQFESLDEKYEGRKEYFFDEEDIIMFKVGLDWLIGVEHKSDDTDLLDINRQQAIKLSALLNLGHSEISSSDWF